MRYAAARTLAALVVGVAAGRVTAVPWPAAAAALVFGLVAARRTRWLSLYLAVAAAGLLYARARCREPAVLAHHGARFAGTVVAENRRGAARSFDISLERGAGKVRLWSADSVELRYGDAVAVQAPIRHLDYPRNPGLVDFNSMMRRRGFVGSASARSSQIRVTGSGRGGWLMRTLIAPMQRGTVGAVRGLLPGAEGELLLGLLLGGGQGLPPDVRQAFSDAGIVHILAVSGMNVSVLVGALWLLLSILGVRGWWRFSLGAAAVALYVLYTGASAAPARAGLMAVAVLLSVPIQRRVTPMATLSVAGIVLLVIDPASLVDVGAQLSFVATAGIALAMEQLARLSERLVSVRGRRLVRLISPVAVSLSATAATAPLLLHHFFRFQPLAFISSLAVAPLVSLSMPLGLGMIPLSSLPGPLASILAEALRWPLWLVLKTGAVFGSLDWAIVEPGKLGWPAVVWLYGLLLLLSSWRRRPARATFLLVLAVGLNVIAWRSAFVRPETEVVFLDPGVGDAVLLTDRAGRRLLVDAGIDGRGVLRDYLRSRGIHRLDAAIITHPDRDHYGGLLELGPGLRVDNLFVATLASRDTAYTAMLDRLIAKGTRVAVAGAGARVEGLGIDCEFIWPNRASRSLFEDGRLPVNAVSLVGRVTVDGYSLLLTGDMEETHTLADIRADLLKSPHHGSRRGNPDSLLAAVRPDAVVVMGRYPTPANIEARCDSSGIACFNTRRDGAVTLVLRGRGPEFRTLD